MPGGIKWILVFLSVVLQQLVHGLMDERREVVATVEKHWMPLDKLWSRLAVLMDTFINFLHYQLHTSIGDLLLKANTNLS